jgi:hypothetical protein
VDSENKNTLGVLDWLVLGILLAFTSAGTFGLVQITAASDGLSLLIRQVTAVCFTDGIILYWHNRRTKYEDTEQRKYATYAMWAGVVTVLIFTVIYGAESVLLDGGLKLYKVTMFNMAVPLSELLGFTVTVILGLQAAGTLALILYIEQLNPRAKMLIEQRKAESEINKQQLTDYKTAQNTIAGVVGQAKAITALRSQLTALGYNERETEILVRAAMQKIADSKMIELPDTGSVPVSNGTGGGSLAENFFGTKARNKN